MIGYVVAYVVIAIIWFVVIGAFREDARRRERRFLAIVQLFAPIWPLGIIFLVVVGIVRHGRFLTADLRKIYR